MWWDAIQRKWFHHPQCKCNHTPCYCPWLSPLDEQGRPLPALWDEQKPAKAQAPKEAA